MFDTNFLFICDCKNKYIYIYILFEIIYLTSWLCAVCIINFEEFYFYSK